MTGRQRWPRRFVAGSSIFRRLSALGFRLVLEPGVESLEPSIPPNWGYRPHAQASITGVVRDASGAVLPGVTVEASSPALIEKVRSVVTDGTGQYRIIDLRPGTYVVTYTLSGFSIVRREGIELTGTFVATIDVDLRVGGLEETITVTGDSPIVDIQRTTQQRVFDQEVIEQIPVGRSHINMVVLIPGLAAAQPGRGALADVGGTNNLQNTTFTIHGGRTAGPLFQRHHTAGDRALGDGSTPFMRAAKSGDVVVMRLLLEAGADPKLTQPNQANALMLAAGMGWRDGSPAAPSYDQGSERDAIEAIKLCMQSGLDINAATNTGETTLHAAISGRGSLPIVRFLVENGADLGARNKQGRTPLEVAIASRRELPEIVAYLKSVN